MKPLARLLVSVLASWGAVACVPARASEETAGEAAPIFGIKLPAGYRDFRLIGVAREEWLEDIRGILGNDKAIEAYRAGKLPFPDGTVIARLAWEFQASEENERAFARVMKPPPTGRFGSFVAGHPKNGVQFMLKDSKKFAATGGWGFAQFNEGKPADEKLHQGCFPCHEAARERDFVFTRYAR
jgi:hypothetical protein